MADTKANLLNTVYKFGGVENSKPLPVGVTLSLDSDMKATILKTVGILSIGIGAGIAVGIIISENKKNRRRKI